MRDLKYRQYIPATTVGGTYLAAHWNYWGVIDRVFKMPLSGGDGLYPSDQYTGLTDKNGVEIYEGDIVKGEGHIGDITAPVEYRYDEGFFGFTNGGERNDYHKFAGWFITDEPLSYPEETEVIGNIRENAEMLE